MHFANISGSLALAVGLAFTSAFASAQPADTSPISAEQVQLQQIRNATLKISYADTTFLVDPMLARKGTYPGFEGTYRSELRNPLVELPMPAEEVFAGVDAVIVTHTHLDHWDAAAQQMLPKDVHCSCRTSPMPSSFVGKAFATSESSRTRRSSVASR